MKTDKLRNKAQVIFSKKSPRFLALPAVQGSMLAKKWEEAPEAEAILKEGSQLWAGSPCQRPHCQALALVLGTSWFPRILFFFERLDFKFLFE